MAVRHRRDRAQDGGRVRAQGHGHRERFARVGLLPLAEIQCSAAVGEPAHDHAVFADHLLAVDAQVLPLLVRAAGHHQRPGDQGAGIPGPAGLHRDAREVHLVAFEHLFLAGCAAHLLRCHVQHLAEHRQLIPGIAEALRRFRLAQEGQQLADLAQRLGALRAHAQRHPARGAEQVAEHRHAWPPGSRTAVPAATAQGTIADLGHLQLRIHETFVGKLNVAEHKRAGWLGKLDASSLKLKVAAAIVAISSIHLLKAFMNIETIANDKLLWYVVVHLTFVVSAVLMGVMDHYAGKDSKTTPGGL
jgi:hypothetical protein